MLRRLAIIALVALAVYSFDFEADKWDGEVVLSEKDFACHSLPRENYTCGKCIQFHDSCAWCSDEKFDQQNITYSRCDSVERLKEHGCGSWVSPEILLHPVENRPLTNQDEEEENAIQLRPQQMRVQIRPGGRVRFNVTYRQAYDYPVDLYYLMDLSYSMKDDKEKLVLLGDMLAARMKEITKNFRLGFGSFIDKKLMPFIDPRPDKQKSPCPEPCAEPYGFHHQMTLTTKTELFKKKVEEAEISGNLDAPEGGFDALLQALVCNSSIGWRERARKMIVFSTDAGFHFAGDGRLAGVVEPNDGFCHLDKRGYYTKSLDYDYPSIALLHQKAKEHKVNLIFAVTESNEGVYKQLSNSLPDISTSVGVLADDSANIVHLIEAEYNRIAEKIIMIDDANATQGLKVSYRSKCLNGAQMLDTNVCDNIKVGNEITFEVTLENTHCVDQRNFQINIGPSGLDETLRLDVEVLCDCDCEKEENIIRNAYQCSNGRGNLVCGICQCAPGWIGPFCECEADGQSTVELDAKCRKNNESAICEGRGECKCGKCVCFQREDVNERVSGPFCECDNFNCPRHNRKICSDHGTCDCGSCTCLPGWTGHACECPTSLDTCMSADGRICNGHGKCICGKCSCEDDGSGGRYSGPLCEVCPTCPTKCVEYKPCVMCQMWGTGPYNDTRCAECNFGVIAVDELPVIEVEGNAESDECQFVDPADDCTFYYLYHYEPRTNNITVWANRNKNCPAPVPVLVIVLGVIAGIVLLGLLLLLLWKLLTFLADRAEFAKFENERLNARYDANENPIYKQATTTFMNPTYAKTTSGELVKRHNH
ncbi:hypothetical protein L596_025806 [Steinernema carpocapsae]|uniref:Integrin beta n=1 Tax=Steinernema carpocapsae TaxID=34508 RepID=A0A4U5M8W9_STECR|nr:hypothetical protein L596_025806 [Steinernema carpocapsae]